MDWAALPSDLWIGFSACFAIPGNISEIVIPGAAVAIGSKGPRISAGAPGFMSQVSS